MTGQELAAAISGKEAEALVPALGFNLDFVAKNVMSASGPVTVAQIAMLWMGMPNKHDRKRTRQMLDALTNAGLLESIGDDTYVARRA